MRNYRPSTINHRLMKSIVNSIILICTILTQAHAWDGTEPLIVDHNAVQQFGQIPDYWLEKAKELTVHYGHTSTGSQIIAGLNWLEIYIDPVKYKFKATVTFRRNPVLPIQENPPALLMAEEGAHPYDYWEGEAAQNETIQILNSGSFALSGWQWCGEHGRTEMVEAYLVAMEILDSACPDVMFFYMTGAGGETAAVANNNMIREYCINNNKILFDFADIESYDPFGNHQPGADRRGTWCEEWVQQNPDVYQNIPPTTEVGGGGDGWLQSSHAHGLFAIMKAQAFWWMMARLAGWDGVSQEAPEDPSDEYALGDVNGDGNINIIDVTLAARHAAELSQFQGDALRRANVNGDLDGSGQPKIDILDVILIARRAVGLIN